VPLYEYECESCGKRFERIRKFSDPPIEICVSCGGPVHKLLSSPAIHFKGTGWYVTDYARKNASSSDGGKATNGEAAKTESKAEAKTEARTETKSESKSESKSEKSDSSAGASSSKAK
jgi:putative FmdB family regulatory protein